MSLAAQVQANTEAIQQILQNVKTLGQLTTIGAIEDNDFIIMYDVSEGKAKKILKSNITFGENSTFIRADFGWGVVAETAGDTTTNQEIEDYINAVGFEVFIDKYSIISIVSLQSRAGIIYYTQQNFVFTENNTIGTYGTASTNGEIDYTQLIFLGEKLIQKVDSLDVIIDLGSLGETLIETYINGLDPGTIDWENLADDGTTYYFACIISGEIKLYKYVGAVPVTFGSGGDVTDSFDYELVEYNSSNGLDADINVKSIDGYIVDVTNNADKNAIEVGNTIAGFLEAGRYIIGVVTSIPVVDDTDVDLYLDAGAPI